MKQIKRIRINQPNGNKCWVTNPKKIRLYQMIAQNNGFAGYPTKITRIDYQDDFIEK